MISAQVKNTKGFTLIELMVAITIVAILAVVGLTIFNNAQRSARDSRRSQDINAITKALEQNRVAVASTATPVACPNSSPVVNVTQPSYCPLQNAWFSANTVPTDPQGNAGVYCIQANNTNTVISDLTFAGWTTANTCPAGWNTVAASTPTTSPVTNFKVCARMEATNSVFCVGSQQ